MTFKILPLLLVSSLALSGCTMIGMATGAGASLGVAASQEGGLSRAASDLKIQAQINNLWFSYNSDIFLKLDMTVNQGRVLLTGVVQDPEHRVEAVRLAWQPEGVKQVINEIQVADSEGVMGYAKDAWITTRLRTALTFDSDVQSINYSIDTVRGVVYLIGAAQNQAELNRVIEIARTISNVKRVVSYVKLVGKDISDSMDMPVTKAQQEDYPPASEYVTEEPDMAMPDGYSPNDLRADERSYDTGTANGAPQPLIESEPLDPN